MLKRLAHFPNHKNIVLSSRAGAQYAFHLASSINCQLFASMGFEEPDHTLRRRDCPVAHWPPDLLSRQLESSETSLTPLEGCYGLARRQDFSREKMGTALIQPVISPDAC
jgi:hypothetical protein